MNETDQLWIPQGLLTCSLKGTFHHFLRNGVVVCLSLKVVLENPGSDIIIHASLDALGMLSCKIDERTADPNLREDAWLSRKFLNKLRTCSYVSRLC